MKVLISAYACEPNRGSEPGVGWNWVQQIARFNETWVITRENNRGPIAHGLEHSPLQNVHWIYYDLPRWARFWKKGQRGIHLYYYFWQMAVYLIAKRLHREVGFEIVHHVTFGNYWIPTFLSLLPVCFVWGPLGGGESAPRPFYRTYSLRGSLYERSRDVARWISERTPVVRSNIRKAEVALAKARETAERLQRLGTNRVELYSESGLTKDEIAALNALAYRTSGPFRLVSIGNLLHLKGFHLGLLAFAQFQRDFPDAEYWLIGDGPERRNLERLARADGIERKVHFWGRVPRRQVLEKLAECDVLVHPSLHDSGGWVCLEAMAAGRPVICLDLGGPASQVTEQTGIKVPALFPEQAIGELAQAMSRLARDPNARISMGDAGKARIAEHFEWNAKGEHIREIYREACLRTSAAYSPLCLSPLPPRRLNDGG